MNLQDLIIDIEHLSSGPVSATALPDGSFVVVDFQLLDTPTHAVRVAFPTERLESLIGGLNHILISLADPTSGIHLQMPH